MARAVVVASGTADAQAFTGACTLVGYSVRESAGIAAVATVVLRDGTAATDPLRVLIELPADRSETTKTPAIDFANGVFVDRVAGETELVLYLL